VTQERESNRQHDWAVQQLIRLDFPAEEATLVRLPLIPAFARILLTREQMSALCSIVDAARHNLQWE